MKRINRLLPTGLVVGCLAVVAGSFALAQPTKDNKDTKQPAGKPGAPPEIPGISKEDMDAYMAAGKLGPMHEKLRESVGTWTGKSKQWMAPGTDPLPGEMTETVSAIMNGHYTRTEITGECAAMGQTFNGLGIYGFDNVSQKFQSTFISDESTGIMFGTGTLAADGKTLTFNYTFNCPITKKPDVMRAVEKWTGKDTKMFEMYGNDPKTGKEFKMMEVELTRKAGSAPTGTR